MINGSGNILVGNLKRAAVGYIRSFLYYFFNRMKSETIRKFYKSYLSLTSLGLYES